MTELLLLVAIRRARLLRIERPAFMFSTCTSGVRTERWKKTARALWMLGGQSVPLRSQRQLELRFPYRSSVLVWVIGKSGDRRLPWLCTSSAGWNRRAVRSRDPVESVVGPPLGGGRF